MFRRNVEQLNETAKEWIKGLPNYFKNVLSRIKDQGERSLKIAEVMKRAKSSTNDPVERKEVLDLIVKLRNELPNLNTNITEGEVKMSNKKTNLDMFLEGVEEVEVAKKPKFHSVYRLYEAKDEDDELTLTKYMTSGKRGCDKSDRIPTEVAVKQAELKKGNPQNPRIDEEGDEEEEEGAEHEASETDDEEEAEKEAGDDDEAGGEDESPETDDDESSEGDDDEASDEDEGSEDDMEENVADDVLGFLGQDAIEGVKQIIVASLEAAGGAANVTKDMVKKVVQNTLKKNPELQRMQAERAKRDASRGKGGMPKPPPTMYKQEDEMDEGAQGYAAGLRGVRKDAGAKKLKSGANKVPAPKVQITGDKKLLKKPTTLKGDSYPKSSVAGAARPGAPKVKRS